MSTLRNYLFGFIFCELENFRKECNQQSNSEMTFIHQLSDSRDYNFQIRYFLTFYPEIDLNPSNFHPIEQHMLFAIVQKCHSCFLELLTSITTNYAQRTFFQMSLKYHEFFHKMIVSIPKTHFSQQNALPSETFFAIAKITTLNKCTLSFRDIETLFCSIHHHYISIGKNR